MIDAALVKLGQEPIPGDNPAGREVRAEESYLAIQAEIERLSALSGAQGGVNWALVVELGKKILAEDAKDLTVAVYLAQGLLETRPIAYLASVATFLSEFLENFWETAYPPVKRLRARKNSLDWWREKTLIVFKRFEGQLTVDESAEMVAAVQRLDHILDDRDLVNLMELVNLVKNCPIKAEPAPASSPEVDKPKTADAIEQASAPSPVPQSSQELPSPQELQQALLAAANNYLGAQLPLSDPWRWKLGQLAQWLPLVNPPPSEANRTQLPGPPQQTLINCQTLLSQGQAARALNALEDEVVLYPFWLDFHKARYDCLVALGFQTAAEALKGEISFFYHQWPSLRTLTFEDGTNLCSPETNQWLTESAGDAPVTENEFQDLQSLARGDPNQGLSALAKPANRPTDGRGLLAVRLVEAQLWARLGRLDLAQGLANWLLDRLDAQSLDTWEPALAIQTLKVVHAIFSRDSAHPEKAAAVALRLALLNPDAALDLQVPLPQ
ncbi:MAG: type VI secretion system protein TssA [Deltaproteobacteria bacterium]|jgi:type VI secretion system protein VasJ|nr:type VI secretion system protein TssA [Deltaproteobacteria bacterium]